jgi:predicted Zn-dependent peptidase
VRLDNGLTLLLLEKPGPPLVSFELVLRSGAAGDPPGKEGLAATTLALLRKGTRRRSAREFSALVDGAGALYGATVDQDLAYITAEFLSRDAELGLGLVAEALLSPTFPEAEVEKRIRLVTDAIRDDKDSPLSVIGRYHDGALFEGHPYGRPAGGTEASLAGLTRADVVAFHAARTELSVMILVVAGVFDRAAMPALVERAFQEARAAGPGGVGADRGASRAGGGASSEATGAQAAPRSGPAAFGAPETTRVRGRKVLLVDKPDEETGYFRFGNVGIAFDDPEWVLSNLARTVLGGCFTSWLNTALRVDEGLTYGVQAEISRRRRPGPVSISSFARADAVGRAIDIALAQLRRLHDEGIGDEALEAAKSYVRGQFPLAIETAEQLAEAFARFEAFGVPHEWISEYLVRVERATAEEVSRVARRVFPREEDLVFTLIGPADRLGSVAERLGPVTRKRIADPGF